MTRASAVLDPRLPPDGGHVAGDGGPFPVRAAGPADDCDALWSICLLIAERRRRGLPSSTFAVDAAGGIAVDAVAARGGAAGVPSVEPAGEGGTRETAGRGLQRDARGEWQLGGDWSAPARALFDLYRPLLQLGPGEAYRLGHLGQSLDGRIATSSGDSCFINGRQNLVHMHRLRALCDAVLVGAATVVADDPQLTTRLVPGPHATRVVLDPSVRLTPAYRICSDDACPTLIARVPPPAGGMPASCGRAEIIAASTGAAGIDLSRLLDCLADRGLHVILVEGGGITVSRFLAQRLLHRLQIAVAPVIIGSGRQGLQLPEVLALGDCLRPPCRHHAMGPDVLWDLDLRAAPAAAVTSPAGQG